MNVLERTNSSIINSKVSSDILMEATDKIERHINIQRLHHFRDNGRDNYYRILWILRGVDRVAIDEEVFTPYANLIVFVSPEKRLKLETSEQPEGWVMRLSQEYLNILRHDNFAIANMEFVTGQHEIHKLVLSPKIGKRVHSLAGMIDELSGSQIPMKEDGIYALLKTILVYCDSKCNLNLNITGNRKEVSLVSRFKQLVTENYTRYHMVSDYASLMKITPKYLNQVVKQIMGVTAKQVIREQLIIHARHDLKFSNDSIKEIAFQLGFIDPFHFSSFFKDMVGCSPTRYREK